MNILYKCITKEEVFFYGKSTINRRKNKKSRNLEGYFAIDVKSRKEPWRIILQPLDENEDPFDSSNIDQIAAIVKIVEISEVSRHYE